jgi:predicted O-methyltransferase YrrM
VSNSLRLGKQPPRIQLLWIDRMLSPLFANIDLSAPDPIPAILVSPQYHEAVRFFANSASIKDALISPDSQALLYCLIRLQRPMIAVEIGTYMASTTEAMARAIVDNGRGDLHTVDPFAIRGRLNIARWPAKLRKGTRFHFCNSMQYFAKMTRRRMRIDLAFVDGNHDYEFALFDIQSAARLISPGGFIVIDNIAQPGPFLAARDFMERAHSRGWRECGNSLARFKAKQPFDRDRTTIHNTDFCVLRAPSAISVGSQPVSFGELAWTSQSSMLRLRLQKEAVGRLQAQFIIRVFENPPREIIESTSVELTGRKEIDVLIPFPPSLDNDSQRLASLLLPIRRPMRRTVETWLTWEGSGDLELSELPSIG